MEKIFEYLWRNVKYAVKTVFSRLKEYVPFFVALFVIQVVFFTSFMTTATNYKNRYEKISEKYDYDMLISGLSYNQYIAIEERLYVMSYMKKRTFESYKISKLVGEKSEEWQIYVLMRDGSDNEDFLNYFIYSVIGTDSGAKVSYTPLNEYRNSNIGKSTPEPTLIFALTLISAAALFALYTVRVNHDRFRYGIYATYGASFKRLMSTSFFEMLVVLLVTLPFSALFSYVVASLFYGRFDVRVVFSALGIISVLLANFVVVLLGVFLPMKFLSFKAPMSLIIAEDNSNLVSSPRSTKFLSGDKFLRIYEMMGMWRFRKYYLKLLVSAVAFSAIFICGVYISDMNDRAAALPIEEFKFESKSGQVELASSEKKYDSLLEDVDFISNSFSGMDGVASVEYGAKTYASDIGAIVLMDSDSAYRATVASTKYVNNEFDATRRALRDYYKAGYYNATNMYRIEAFDENSVKMLSRKYEIDGDPYSILNSENTVIVSESVLNTQRYSFEVGDKIILARIISSSDSLEIADPFDTVSVVEAMLTSNEYEFYEYTVGAVIKESAEGEGYFTVGVPYAAYESLVGSKPIPTTVSVYLESDVSEDEYNVLSLKAKQIINSHGNDFSLRDTYGYLYRTIDREKCSYEFGVMLSLLVLSMSPIVWFYSQSLFYKKREKEMYVLSAFGGTPKIFKRIHTASSLILSALAFVFTVLLGIAASLFIFKFMNEWITGLGFGTNINYEFYISPSALALCLVTSAVCSFLSCYLPYRKMVRKNRVKKGRSNREEDTDIDVKEDA